MKLDFYKLAAMEKSLSILLLGQPGIGKSTLVNGLIGQKLAKVSKKGKISREGVTKELEAYEIQLEDYVITIWDTPGLLDPQIGSVKTLQGVKKICDSIDLFLFCININANRVYLDGVEDEMIKLVTEILGEEVWNKTLVVLVQANLLIHKLRDQEDNEEIVVKTYNENVMQWRCILQEKIPVSGVKVIPVGYYKKPKLFPKDKLPWLSNFWKKCFKFLPDKKKKIFANISINRLLVCSETKVLQPVCDGGTAKLSSACASIAEEQDSESTAYLKSSSGSPVQPELGVPGLFTPVPERPIPVARFHQTSLPPSKSVETSKYNTLGTSHQPVPVPRKKKRTQSLPAYTEYGDISSCEDEAESIFASKIGAKKSNYSDSVDATMTDINETIPSTLEDSDAVKTTELSFSQQKALSFTEITTQSSSSAEIDVPSGEQSVEVSKKSPSTVKHNTDEISADVTALQLQPRTPTASNSCSDNINLSKSSETAIIDSANFCSDVDKISSSGSEASNFAKYCGQGIEFDSQMIMETEPTASSTPSQSTTHKEERPTVHVEHKDTTEQSIVMQDTQKLSSISDQYNMEASASSGQLESTTPSKPKKLSSERFSFLNSTAAPSSNWSNTLPTRRMPQKTINLSASDQETHSQKPNSVGKLPTARLSLYEQFSRKTETLPQRKSEPLESRTEPTSSRGSTLPRSFPKVNNTESPDSREKSPTLPSRTPEEKRQIISPTVKKLQDDISTKARISASSDEAVLQRIRGASNTATYLTMNDDFIKKIRVKDLEDQPIIISEGFFGKVKRIFSKFFGF